MLGNFSENRLVRTMVEGGDHEKSRALLEETLGDTDLHSADYDFFIYLPDLSEAPAPAVGPDASEGERSAALHSAIEAAPKTVEYRLHGDVEDDTLMWYHDELYEAIDGIESQLQDFFERGA